MNVQTQIETLSSQIDDLTTTISPLLSTPLTQHLSTLPLLDKAKLQILQTYAIESLLFSSIQLSGQDARSHAVFNELARLRTYFAKVKDAEEREKGPRMRVDQEAAARFVRAGLAGNERVGVHKKFEDGEVEGQKNAEVKTEKKELDKSDKQARRDKKHKRRLERAKAEASFIPASK